MRRVIRIGGFVLVVLAGLAPASSGIDIELTVWYPIPCDGSAQDGIDTIFSTGPGAEVTLHSGMVQYGDEETAQGLNCRWASPEFRVRNLIPMMSYTWGKRWDVWRKDDEGNWHQTYESSWTGPHTTNSGGNDRHVINDDVTRQQVYEWYSHIEVRKWGSGADVCAQDYGYVKTNHLPDD